MKRSKSQAVYRILPGMWINDKDHYGRSAAAYVKSWNYQKMEGIYNEFVEAEIQRQILLFGMRGGDISAFNLSEPGESFSIVEAACRPDIPDILAELSPLFYYCPDCHKVTQYQKASAVKLVCPACGKGHLKQLPLVYPCECGYASPVVVPKVTGVRDFYYYPNEKRYGVFYYQGKSRMFKEFGMKCPNCGSYIQRDSATSPSNYKAFTVSVINLINDQMGKFFEKGLPAQKIMVAKWFNKLSQDQFNDIIKNVDYAFSEKNTNAAAREEAESKAKALVASGIIPESQLEATVATLLQSGNGSNLSVEDFQAACDAIFAKEKKQSEDEYDSWIKNLAFNLIQYETIKNARHIVTLDDAIKEEISMGFIDDASEIDELNAKLGFSNVQASENIEIINGSYGYTRKVTDPKQAKGQLRLVAYAKDGDTNRNLVYSMKLETEGILFDVDRSKILKWLLLNHVITENDMPDIEDEISVKKWFAKNIHADHISSFGDIDEDDNVTKYVFYLLHSISHALMKTAGELSGISTNSITEMIFVDTCSIFIYSQSSQGQVLGSLSGMFESLYGRFARQTYQDNRECIYDPICAERDDSSCQGCLVLADTTCKYFNTKLGRKYLYSLHTDENIIGFWEM